MARVRGSVSLLIGLAVLVPAIATRSSFAAPATFSTYTAPESSFGWAHSTSEPTIGVNPQTNAAMFEMTLDTARVEFDDSTQPATATWTNVTYPVSSANTLDPILWTDPATGRTFVTQLYAAGSVEAFTDDDGATWQPALPLSAPSVDHETIGSGPYANPAPALAGSYPHAVYYCAQGVVEAQCARSDDGGQTWGAPIPIHVDTCFAGHGHVTVGGDGTVYVPFKNCGLGQQGMMLSRDNGVTWTVSRVPGTVAATSVAVRDPKVVIDADGTLYFVCSSQGKAVVATSVDHGGHWTALKDVGAPFGIRNAEFPMAIAGDGGRAAVGFYGTTAAGDDQVTNFAGRWNLYVAFTYDGGATWQTIDVTPGDPVFIGRICLAGTTCNDADRRLADFMDMTTDNHGRVLVGYSDGCTSAACIGPNGTHATSTDAWGTIARQSAGLTLNAAFD